jgi:predicted Rossmann fold nucleotide-binding protein DprA/Smf involved in DNA uptake
VNLGSYEWAWLQTGKEPEIPILSSFATKTTRRSVREYLCRLGMESVAFIPPGDSRYPGNGTTPLYCVGNIDLLHTPCLSIVGGDDAGTSVRDIAQGIARKKATLVSTMKPGVNRTALESCVEAGGTVIVFLKGPITEAARYTIGNNLLVSVSPIYYTHREQLKGVKVRFPKRNAVMAALAKATFVLNAKPRTAPILQARHALEAGRKVLLSSKDHEQEWFQSLMGKGAQIFDPGHA